MMMDDIFLYDTYALVEIFNKNPKYEAYIDKDIIINEFIFAEFCYKLFLYGVENAQEYIEEIVTAVMIPTNGVIEKAMLFRAKNKHKKMSVTDCISYLQAKELGIKFLTGDKEFENMDNVEFVKK